MVSPEGHLAQRHLAIAADKIDERPVLARLHRDQGYGDRVRVWPSSTSISTYRPGHRVPSSLGRVALAVTVPEVESTLLSMSYSPAARPPFHCGH